MEAQRAAPSPTDVSFNRSVGEGEGLRILVIHGDFMLLVWRLHSGTGASTQRCV